jgi:NitT/TauT family transport system substrate-binding protein
VRGWAIGLGLALLLACRPAAPATPPAASQAAVPAPPGPASSSSTQGNPGGASPTPALAPIPLKLMLGTAGASSAAVIVAQQGGFTTRYGLAAELVLARSGAEALSAVLGRDAPIGAMGGTAVINAVAGGAGLVVVALANSRLTQQLVVAPDVRTPQDLRGKRIAVTDVGGSTDLAAQYILDKFGLRRGEDVAISALGGNNERIGALQVGAVQGTMLSAPFTLLARKAGYPVLFDLTQEDYELPSISVVTSREALANQPEVARRFVRALVDAIHSMKTDRESTIAVLERYLQQSDPEILEDLYGEAAGNALPEAPYPSVRAFGNAIKEIAPRNEAVASLRPEDLVDDRFVRELDESGYIRALYGR